MTSGRGAVIAISGNSLIRDGQRGTNRRAVRERPHTARQIGALATAGWRIVVTHGDGPQVGFILLRTDDAGR